MADKLIYFLDGVSTYFLYEQEIKNKWSARIYINRNLFPYFKKKYDLKYERQGEWLFFHFETDKKNIFVLTKNPNEVLLFASCTPDGKNAVTFERDWQEQISYLQNLKKQKQQEHQISCEELEQAYKLFEKFKIAIIGPLFKRALDARSYNEGFKNIYEDIQ